MGIAALQIRVLPESPETDTEELKEKITKILKEKGAVKVDIEIQEVAFGLKALNITIAWPESQDTDTAENCLKDIKGVSSVSIEDYRRAFG